MGEASAAFPVSRPAEVHGQSDSTLEEGTAVVVDLMTVTDERGKKIVLSLSHTRRADEGNNGSNRFYQKRQIDKTEKSRPESDDPERLFSFGGSSPCPVNLEARRAG
jgi:hypothetical protein